LAPPFLKVVEKVYKAMMIYYNTNVWYFCTSK